MKLTTVDGSGAKRVVHVNAPVVEKPTVFMPTAIPLLPPKQVERLMAALGQKPPEPEE